MQHKFYPSIIGRLGYLLIVFPLGFLFLVTCLFLIYPFGEMFAADWFEFIDLILFLLSLSVAFFVGLPCLYYLILAISPYPYMIIDRELREIQIRSVGTFGYAKIKLNGIRYTKPKGMFRHLYLQLLILPQQNIRAKQNIVFKIAFKFLKYTYLLVTLKFWKKFRTRAYQHPEPEIIGIYRTSVGVPLSEIENTFDQAFEINVTPTLAVTQPNNSVESVIIRTKPKNMIKLGSSALASIFIFIVCISPICIWLLGYYAYQSDLIDDASTKEAQSVRALAVGGDADAQNEFGKRLLTGNGVPQSKMRSNRWFRKSAKQKYFKAQYNLGLSYKCDHVKNENSRKHRRACKDAIDWFRKSANQGYFPAQSQMGYRYYQGLGVRQSYSNAYFWFEKAAMQNDGYALYFMGLMYEKGLGVDQSTKNAVQNYKAAAEQGFSKANEALLRMLD